LLLVTFASANISVRVVFIFVGSDSLGLPHPRTHNQGHIILVIVIALPTLRKPLRQPFKMQMHAQPLTPTKLHSSPYMRRAQDPFAETPNLGMRTQRKVEFTQRDRASYNVARELHDELV